MINVLQIQSDICIFWAIDFEKNPLLRVLLIQLRRSQVLFVDVFIKLPPSVCCTFKCKVPFPGKVLALAIFGLKPSPKPKAATKKKLPDENLAWGGPKPTTR